MSEMTMEFDGVRELSLDEVDEVNGAWVANAIGAGLGALGAGAGAYAASGGNWRAVGIAAAGGAVVGLMNPVRGAASAAAGIRAAHFTMTAGAAGAGVGLAY